VPKISRTSPSRALRLSMARDGDVLEILGTYDPSVKIKESRVILKPTRIKYWLSVGAQPSDHVAIFLEKYMEKFEKAEAAASSGS